MHTLRTNGPDAVTSQQRAQLDGIGFTFDFDEVRWYTHTPPCTLSSQTEALWWAHFHTYQRYVDVHKTPHLPSQTWHEAWRGFRSTFTTWYWQQQQLFRDQMLPLHKVRFFTHPCTNVPIEPARCGIYLPACC